VIRILWVSMAQIRFANTVNRSELRQSVVTAFVPDANQFDFAAMRPAADNVTSLVVRHSLRVIELLSRPPFHDALSCMTVARVPKGSIGARPSFLDSGPRRRQSVRHTISGQWVCSRNFRWALPRTPSQRAPHRLFGR
jgi:hypothetical protein